MVSKGFIWGEDYMGYVPDDAIILALLHHILDLCMYFLRRCSIERDESHLMVEFAEQIFRNSYINELRGLVSTTGEPFNEVFRRLIDTVKGMSGQVWEVCLGSTSLMGTPHISAASLIVFTMPLDAA